MNHVLADTNVLLWYLFDPSRLSPAADTALTSAANSGTIYISVITLVELIYLQDRFTFEYPQALSTVYSHLADPTSPLKLLPLLLDEARAVSRVPRAEVSDMPDRIIAGTAVSHRLPLISSDSMIRSSVTLRSLVTVIW